MADADDLKSSEVTHEGSTPSPRTNLGQEWVSKVTNSDGPEIEVIGVPLTEKCWKCGKEISDDEWVANWTSCSECFDLPREQS